MELCLSKRQIDNHNYFLLKIAEAVAPVRNLSADESFAIN